MTDIILVLIILLIAGGAVTYIYKQKKQGRKCIGCPYSKQCESKNCSCSDK